MSSVITGRQHCAWYWQPHALARRPESCCPMGATLRTPPHSRPHFCFHARNSAKDLQEQSAGIRNDKAVRPPIVCERLLSMEEQGQPKLSSFLPSHSFLLRLLSLQKT
ncbi:hypothetical protein NQZ68_013690 [Dissostichus eleginoides]|nr:hypothetical protein NQZ68_013690 [Dissostichus eleginoides]